MSLSVELKDRLNDPQRADAVMMEIAAFYIREPGITMSEIADLSEKIPFINSVPREVQEEVLNRLKMANDILPEVREVLGSFLHSMGIPGEGKETLDRCRNMAVDVMPLAQISFDLVHGFLGQIDEMASQMNLPKRELQAALARVGIESAVYLIANSTDIKIKNYAKTNLIYFSDLEMLAVGCRTNSYQYGFVDPGNVRPELLIHTEQIMPIIMIDDSLKGPLAFGEMGISDNIPSGIPGMNFLYPDN